MKEGVCCQKTGDGNGTDTSSTTQSTGVRVGKINSQAALARHGGRRASLAIGNVQPASTCKICCVGGAFEHRLIEKRGSRGPSLTLPPAAPETTRPTQCRRNATKRFAKLLVERAPSIRSTISMSAKGQKRTLFSTKCPNENAI